MFKRKQKVINYSKTNKNKLNKVTNGLIVGYIRSNIPNFVYNIGKGLNKYNIQKKKLHIQKYAMVNSWYGWLQKPNLKTKLKLRGFQRFYYINFVKNQFNVGYINKLRLPRTQVPWVNRSTKGLLYFYRKYSRVFIKALFNQWVRMDSTFLQEDFRLEKKTEKKRTFTQIIEQTYVRKAVRAGLFDINGKYEYRKTKFTVIPKAFEWDSSMKSLDFFFYRDFTETLFPHWDQQMWHYYKNLPQECQSNYIRVQAFRNKRSGVPNYQPNLSRVIIKNLGELSIPMTTPYIEFFNANKLHEMELTKIAIAMIGGDKGMKDPGFEKLIKQLYLTYTRIKKLKVFNRFMWVPNTVTLREF